MQNKLANAACEKEDKEYNLGATSLVFANGHAHFGQCKTNPIWEWQRERPNRAWQQARGGSQP